MNKFKLRFLLSMITLLFLVSCNSVNPKEDTTLDRGKKYLKQAARGNYAIATGIELSSTVSKNMRSKLDLNLADKRNMRKKPENKFNITADKVPAKSFFLGLVEGTDENITVHSEVEGDISLTLKKVSIQEVLDITKKIYGYDFEKTATGYQIQPATLRTKIFHVNYLDMIRTGKSDTRVSSSSLDKVDNNNSDSNSNSDNNNNDTGSNTEDSTLNSRINTTTKSDFWSQLQTSLEMMLKGSEGRSIAINPMAGIVIVKAMPEELRRIEEYLTASEQSLNRQVILEAKILEVELSENYRSGINWALINKNIRLSDIAGHSTSLDSTAVDLPFSVKNLELSPSVSLNGGATGTLDTVMQTAQAFGGVAALGLSYNRLAAFIELLGGQGNVQVLSSPRVATTNNQKAIIKVGVDKFFVTNVSSTNTTAVGGLSTSSPTVEFDSFFSGIALDVTPQIKEDGYITLHIHPTISAVTTDNITVSVGTSGANAVDQTFPLAQSSVRESDSIVRAQNGQVVVIGGLMQDKMVEKILGVPGLKDIPFVGSLFRNTVQESKKSELVILLRPTVVGDEEWVKVAEETYDRFEKLDRGFHAGGNSSKFGNLAETQGYN